MNRDYIFEAIVVDITNYQAITAAEWNARLNGVINEMFTPTYITAVSRLGAGQCVSNWILCIGN